MTPKTMPQRCLLFVPGSRPDRFDKAIAAGADAVCLDLEDAVAQPEKLQARENALRWLAQTPAGITRRGVRCNAVSTDAGRADLEAMVAADCRPDFLMVPKVSEASELEVVSELWPHSPPLLCIIETPLGVLNAAPIAVRANAGLLFGAADLSAELGVSPSSDLLAHAKAQVILAGKAARVEILDTPFLGVHDTTGLEKDADRARALGFTGKAAVHPCQVSIILAAFTPTALEVATAERALAAFSEGGGRAMLFEGKLLEKPVIEGYQRTLELAARAVPPAI